jgi:hypothetical protein
MGQIFKNSEKAKTFWIKNNHRNFIFVKLDIDSNNLPDLQRTFPKSHVIAPGEMQGFRIVVFSSVVRKSVYPVRYTINYKHSFKLKVYAEVILVKLEIQNSFNKFTFRNDKYEKDKVEMSVTQKLRLYNGGNAPAEIFWDNNREKAFSISPKKDTILPRTEKTLYLKPNELKMNPNPNFNQFAGLDNGIINVNLRTTSGFSVIINAPKSMSFEDLFINFANKAGVPPSTIGKELIFLYNAQKMDTKSKLPLSSLFKTTNAKITIVDVQGIIGA